MLCPAKLCRGAGVLKREGSLPGKLGHTSGLPETGVCCADRRLYRRRQRYESTCVIARKCIKYKGGNMVLNIRQKQTGEYAISLACLKPTIAASQC